LLESGDYEALMRRMTVMAYEDIGLANPAIPVHVFTACQAFRQLGMPEGIIPLGLVIVEMALSQKSNSAYLATNLVKEKIDNGLVYDVPDHLKDSSYKSAKKLGRGNNYKYPHDFPNDYVDQQYLPKEIEHVRFYHPKKTSVYEKRVYQLYEEFTKKKLG
jgi:putative ATPase